MVRLIMAGLLVGCALVVAPVGGALPTESCPPTCDRIPATAWPAPGSLPMDTSSHWPLLAGLAAPVRNPRFYFEELCASPQRDDDPRRYVVAAKTEVAAPPGQWQLRAQVLHWRGETWRGGQLVTSVFDQAVADLRNCQAAAPQFSPSITTSDGDRMAAVISGPQVVHQYLVAHPQSSTISELVLWVTPPPGRVVTEPWNPLPDARVLDAMADPLCGAYLSSCG
ncbi:ATPase [Mycolicibacterium mengxianglii]|uniref:ATPase n=1 Tax=Mycolicibacterium mengxianglii TaxID=2736649 RepID=UPI001E2898BE|nr:ATPase [Mycolicibacterium mengxianglii]